MRRFPKATSSCRLICREDTDAMFAETLERLQHPSIIRPKTYVYNFNMRRFNCGDYFIIYLWLYSPCGRWPLFQFLNLYIVGRSPWTGDQPVARPLPTHTAKKKTHRIYANRHPYIEWDSNP
jgi:hypothetical protein